MIEWQYKYISK